jgi:hypothetical protein
MDDYHFGYKQKLLKRNSAMATIWQPWKEWATILI